MKKQTQRLLSFTVIAVFTVAISNAQFTNLINGGTKMKVTMGRIFILTMLLLITSTIFAQTPDWQWAAKAGGIDDDEGEAITIDDAGNSYVTGYFQDTTTFDSDTLISSGFYDIFVAKMDAGGNWLWATKAGGTGYDIGYGITIDDAGNCYVTGYFNGTATFGSYSLISGGGIDLFVAKIDTDGNWQWATKAGGTSTAIGYGITIDDAGNSNVTGCFHGTAIFGSDSLTSSGCSDIFVAKMDAGGNWQWATKAGGVDCEDYGFGITIDNAGNTYVTGGFRGTATFGSYNLTSSGFDDIFVAKMDAGGNWQWATKAGGTSTDQGFGITIDDAGNCYVTGYFYLTATFGSYSLTDGGLGDIFVAKIDAGGNWQWATKAGGYNYQKGYAITIDDARNSYVTGYFCGTATFGSYSLTISGYLSDIFVAKMDTGGNWLWATQAGGGWSDEGKGIAIDDAGNSYVTGGFWYTATFGTDSITSSGVYDIFVAKLDSATSETSHALRFDGTDDYVEAVGVPFPTDDLTIEAWINPDTLDGYQEIVFFYNNTSGVQFRTQNDGSLLYGESAGGWNYVVSPANSIIANTWTHVAITKQGDQCNLYINGIHAGYYQFDNNPNPDTLNIGGRAKNMDRFFQGDIDEVRIWTVARSQSEIQSNMYSYLVGTESGLMVYYRMNEGSGQTTFDLSGNGHDGQLGSASGTDTNDPAWIQTNWPYYSHALQFDGTDDYVKAAGVPFPTDDFTIEAWIYPTVLTGYQEIVFFYNDTPGVQFRVQYDSSLLYGESVSGDWDFVRSPANSFSPNTWTHVAVTKQGDHCNLYINGIHAGYNQFDKNPAPDTLSIGARSKYMDRFFEGNIDEVRIWNVALDSSLIRENMYRPLQGNETGLVNYWQFNEGSGSTALDLVGGNNGTLHNMTDANRITSTAPIPYHTISDGNWETNSVWATGQNAPEHPWSRARIKHNITINSTLEVIELKVDFSGILTITTGYQVTVSGE